MFVGDETHAVDLAVGCFDIRVEIDAHAADRAAEKSERKAEKSVKSASNANERAAAAQQRVASEERALTDKVSAGDAKVAAAKKRIATATAELDAEREAGTITKEAYNERKSKIEHANKELRTLEERLARAKALTH